MPRVAAAAALAALLTAVSVPAAQPQPAPGCSGGLKPWIVADLFFGRTRVSDGNWTRFVAREITPRFPDGLTVTEAKGQWRNPRTGRIARERSTVVTIAMPPDDGNDARLREIVEAYKTRFRQQSVGLIVKPACVSF